MYAYSLTLYLAKVYKQREVFVLLFISLMVFGDTIVHDERDKSLRFSCICNQTPITADFGGLIGTNRNNEV